MEAINYHNYQSVDLESWLRLEAISGIGPVTANKILTHFGTASRIFSANTDAWQASGASEKLVNAIYQSVPPNIDSLIEWLKQSESHHLVTRECRSYPRLLAESHAAPLVLYGKGDIKLLNLPQLAIVGSRNHTVSGQQITQELTKDLVANGLCITSGLARGIDGIAHRATLDCGGKTIAVAGTGLDRIYPSRNKALARDIANHGLLISEFPLSTRVRGSNFPKRNRIISGLSLGVLVVEAAVKSGSLITAKYALDQDREIFAVPGALQNPMTRGCHALIKQGAHLVESVEDILQHLGWLHEAQQHFATENHSWETHLSSPVKALPDDDELSQILQWIDFAPTPIDRLVERSKKPVAELSAKLITLELEGWVVHVPGGFQRRK